MPLRLDPVVVHHFALYGVAIIANTVIPSVAAWNLSLVPAGSSFGAPSSLTSQKCGD